MAKVKLSNRDGAWVLELDGQPIQDLTTAFELRLDCNESLQPELILHLKPGAEVDIDGVTVGVAIAADLDEEDGPADG